MRTDAFDRQRRFHRALYDWCLVRAERALRDSEASTAASWAFVAARCGRAFGCGEWASERLETLGLRLAESLSRPKEGAGSAGRGDRWLHVLSIAFRVGGHTKLLQRWIENDASGDIHDLVVTCMEDFDFPELRRTVSARGGAITVLGGVPSLLDRAQQLREAAWGRAHRVLLHIHPFDIVPLLAFGVPGGPPVMLLNHADHVFWVGAAIADQVINFREAARDLCVHGRGIDRNAVLPLPLPFPSPERDRAQLRARLRQRLRIPESTLVFLTIGSEFKYRAIGELDFPTTARRLLATVPGSHLVAVGPAAASAGWAALGRSCKGRVHALGEQPELSAFHAAADIYLEGFPFGSITALLEAGLAGLPFVRLPRLTPPPFSSEHYALPELAQPADIEAYLAQAVALAHSGEARSRQAARAREAILSVHCGDHWNRRFEALKNAMPRAHSIYPVRSISIPDEEDRFWARLLRHEPKPAPWVFIAEQARTRGIRLHPDFRLIRTAMRAGKGASKLLPLVWWATGGVISTFVRAVRRAYRRHLGWRLELRAQRLPKG